MTNKTVKELVERIDRLILKQQDERGDMMFFGEADPELVEARDTLIQQAAEIEALREALATEFGIVESLVKDHKLHLRVGLAAKHDKARALTGGGPTDE